MTGKLQDRCVIVTGAAQGMRRAITIDAAREGAAWVKLADIKTEKRKAPAEAAQAEGARATFVHTDLRSSAAIAAMVEATAEEPRGIDILINNAGVTNDALAHDVVTIETLTAEIWDTVMAVTSRRCGCR